MASDPNISEGAPRTARIGEIKPKVLRKHVRQHRKELATPGFKGLAHVRVYLGVTISVMTALGMTLSLPL